MQEAWTPTFSAADLVEDHPKVFRSGGRQVVLFRLPGGGVHAVDNRCPHEGYPLVQGYVKGCVLTCAWHNWKFDLRDGRCLMGEEDVRGYPVRVRGDRIEVDLADPDPAAEIEKTSASLDTALREYQMGRVARDVVRLLKLGVSPEALVMKGAAWDGMLGPYGPGHALPLAADALRFLGRYRGERAALPILHVLDQAALPNTRRSRRPGADPVDPGSDPAAAGARLFDLAEAEETEAAEGFLRGALRKGWGRDVVEPWLYKLCAAHFLDFGHALIYQVKVFDLLDAVGWDGAEDLLAAHLVGIVASTREDTLPPWESFRRRLEGLAPELPGIYGMQADSGAVRSGDGRAFMAAVLDGTGKESLDAVEDALRRGVPLDRVVDRLALAASERILRFNTSIDADPTVQEGWLDVTHLLTFANALRHAVARYRDPDVLRLVFQSARFINKARPLDMPEGERTATSRGEADVTAVMEAVARKDAGSAVAGAAVLLDDGRAEDLEESLMDFAVSDPAVQPIFVAHVIKTTVAAWEEFRALKRNRPLPETFGPAHPVLALVRFAASPLTECSVRRMAHEAVRFVADGKVPRSLTD